MRNALKYLKLAAVLVMALFCFTGVSMLHAEGGLPPAVQTQLHAPVEKVGSGIYRKFGFSVYRAALWAPNGTWDAAKPYALELHYLRGLSKDTLVDAVMGDIRDQDVADDDKLAKWEKTLNDALPAVEDGDVIVGVAVPGKKSSLYFNGKLITSISDQALSKAFFNIWLGDQANEDLKNKLLGSK